MERPGTLDTHQGIALEAEGIHPVPRACEHLPMSLREMVWHESPAKKVSLLKHVLF